MIDIGDRKTRIKISIALLLLLTLALAFSIAFVHADKGGIPHSPYGKGRPQPIQPIVNQTIINETRYYIENKTIVVIQYQNTTNVYPTETTTIIVEKPVQRETLTIDQFLGMFFMLIGIVIIAYTIAVATNSRDTYWETPSKTITFYELEEKDTDGSLTRFYKTYEE